MTIKEGENEYARHPRQKFQGYGGQEEIMERRELFKPAAFAEAGASATGSVKMMAAALNMVCAERVAPTVVENALVVVEVVETEFVQIILSAVRSLVGVVQATLTVVLVTKEVQVLLQYLHHLPCHLYTQQPKTQQAL
jgi:hypothetical protein